jgi:SagB-type dehydrogenase family enzyme
MVQLLVKSLTAPIISSVLLFFMTGSFMILAGEASGGDKIIKLPDPDREGTIPLETTLQKRRSVRSYQDDLLTLHTVSQLLWAAQGITGQGGLRTAPSAGALYPLEIFVVAEKVAGLTNGIYKYTPFAHGLISIVAGDILPLLAEAALRQDVITQAPAVFVIAGIDQRTTSKYGARGIRYMYMESGHAAQNICLQAVALGLDSVTIGAFSDNEVARLLKMEKTMKPLYIIPVGKAK